MNHPRVCHIIVAAGSGSRFGAALPKQFCMMGERPVVMETIDRMRRFGGEDAEVILVISPEMDGAWRQMCAERGFLSPAVVYGGATRWESVRNALAHPAAAAASVITVHDGARPLLTAPLLARVLDIAPDAAGNIPAVAVTDSLRRIGPGGSSAAVDRSEFRAVQTPQAFRGDLLRRAYRLPYSPEFTDDASVMEAAGFTRLDIVEGHPANIKITHPGDIEIAMVHLGRI